VLDKTGISGTQTIDETSRPPSRSEGTGAMPKTIRFPTWARRLIDSSA
jgi:hypothetical protein